MKVVCDRAVLLERLNLVAGVVPSRTPRMQLTCVKMIAEIRDGVGSLTMMGSDGEASLRLTTDRVDVVEEGEALIPCEKLRQIIAAEDREQTLTVFTDDDAVRIEGEDARFKIYGYPVDEFPDYAAPEVDDDSVFAVGSDTLVSLISRTIFATARENSRYAINGVLLNCDGKTLRLVATDGRRLALAKSSASGGKGVDATGIVPSKALNLASKLAADSGGDVAVRLADSQAAFVFHDEGGQERASLTTALVEGVFPPYEDVVPKDHDKKASFDRDALNSGVRRAALLTNEESRSIRMSFQSGGGESALKLSSRAPEMGEAEISVDVEAYDGDEVEIGFNPQFLSEALKVIEEPKVTIELKASNKPGVIKSGQDFLYVVMPVNLT